MIKFVKNNKYLVLNLSLKVIFLRLDPNLNQINQHKFDYLKDANYF